MTLYINTMFFFFSSRRRHTRCSRDWSSDVCSSDLGRVGRAAHGHGARGGAPDRASDRVPAALREHPRRAARPQGRRVSCRSEEHTSELQSRLHLVCRLLLEKKKTSTIENILTW